jgi:5-methylcytosine-specific restriction protein A
MRAAKACSSPGCPNLQPCVDHERKPWESSRRRENLRNRSGSRQQKLRQFVLHRDEYRCHICGEQHLAAELVNDHVIPLSEGGADDIENMAACCIPCHDAKTQEEARRART